MDITDTLLHAHTPAGPDTAPGPWDLPHGRPPTPAQDLAQDRGLLLTVAADLAELRPADAPARLAPLLEHALPHTQLRGWEWLALEEDTRTYRCARPPVAWPDLLGWTITQLWLGHTLATSPQEPTKNPNGHLLYVSIPAGAHLRGGLGCLVSSIDLASALTALVDVSRLLRIPMSATDTDPRTGPATDEATDEATAQRPLSARQERILALMARGLTNRQIATRIGYSESTVRMETMAIYRALHVRNRHEAAQIAQHRHPASSAADTTNAADTRNMAEHETRNPAQ